MFDFTDELYDLNMLYEQVGSDIDTLKRFIDIFLTSVPEDMESLKVAIEGNNLERTRAAAHKMKSSYMLMGADWARDLCFGMETIAKTGEETEKLPEKFRELQDNFIKMSAKLQAVIS